MPSAQSATIAIPNDLESYGIPFTPNPAFKAAPRLIARAKDMHYYTPEGRAVLDAPAGLWCTNAGHNRDPIVAAIRAQAAELDYAPAFQFSHPKAFELASRVAALAPATLDHVFFCNSGSEAVDTALKIALAYHNVRGEGVRTRLIGRERGYHGVGFGGISVGGMVNNRKLFGALLAGVDHLPTTYNREHQAFSKGEPDWGGHLADELERIVTLHDASTIAAVIVEPMAGSTGVLPAPKGYLPRLRAICDKHGILLVFDEVITGFRRHRPRLAAGRGRQARLRRHGQSIPPGESGGPRRRRDHRAHAAADRERRRDRGDVRQGRARDQSGRLGSRSLSAFSAAAPVRPRERRLRPQDRPADGEHVIAAAERQRERRLNLGIARDAAQGDRHHGRIAAGPHHHRALAAQVAEIDPRRAAAIAVDQHARLLACVMGDVAAVPHGAADVDAGRAGCCAKTP